MDSVIGITKLWSSIGKDREWIPTISVFTYVAEGEYSTNHLDKMWMQQHLEDGIDVLDCKQWGMFNGTYFWRIELSE